VARVGAILKRGGRGLGEAGPKGAVGHNKLRLDPDAWEAQWDGEDVPVTVTEFQLLLLLASLPSKVFTRDAIIDRLHGPGFAITDRTIDSHIRNLRAKFAVVGGGDLIETRAGVGYRIGRCLGEGA
jgi:two-component system OmpR family response regulator